MSDPFVGEIIMFAGNFAPRNWAYCNGQLIAVAQNNALFSLLGTIYGGDGRTTFGLPDLRGRAPMHYGSGPGLTHRNLGQRVGTETVTLTTNQLASHTHTLHAINAPGNSDEPTGRRLAQGVYQNTDPNVSMNAQAIANAGGSQPHTNIQPYQAINFIIALYGVYPSRN